MHKRTASNGQPLGYKTLPYSFLTASHIFCEILMTHFCWFNKLHAVVVRASPHRFISCQRAVAFVKRKQACSNAADDDSDTFRRFHHAEGMRTIQEIGVSGCGAPAAPWLVGHARLRAFFYGGASLAVPARCVVATTGAAAFRPDHGSERSVGPSSPSSHRKTALKVRGRIGLDEAPA